MSHKNVRAMLRGSVSARTVAFVFGAQLALLPSAQAGSALPTSGHYVAGSGAIAKKGSSGLTVNQSSASGIIDWSSFSIGKGNKVNFNNGSGATLNRVTGGDLSTIAGSLKATGSVYLINPQGVIVSRSGRVATGGTFVASSRDESDSDFLNGKRRFRGSSNGDVSNAGKITSASGDVALIGHAAINSGSISANNGTASLAAGNNVLLAPAGSSILISGGSGNVTNSGTLSSAQAQLSAAGGNVYALAGNNGGIVRATGTSTVDGHVWLTSGTGDVRVRGTVEASNANGTGGTVTGRAANIVVTGKVDASATQSHADGGTVSLIANNSTKLSGKLSAKGGTQGHGGFVETSGEHVKIADKAKVSTLGADGLTGDWLIDPNDFTIAASGGDITGAALSTQLASNNVTISSNDGSQVGNGDIFVNDAVSWAATQRLTLNAQRNIEINDNVTITGAGSIVLTSALGGSGDVNIGLGAGAITFTNVASGNSTALRINGQFYTLENNLEDLAGGANTNFTGRYALAQDDDESGNGTYTKAVIPNLLGDVEGLGHTIANLVIEDDGSSLLTGLFGSISGQDGRGSVRDLQLKNVSIDATTGAGSFGGGLAGRLIDGGVISNVAVSGNITYAGTGGVIGGLVGDIEGSTSRVENASSSVRVSAVGDQVSAGGLVGRMFDATISNAMASGNVSVNGEFSNGGGLIGENNGSINNAYALGSVTGKDESEVGGFAGFNDGAITHAYSMGGVSGGTKRGGFVGWNSGGSIEESYETGKVKTGSGAQGAFVGQNDGSIGNSKADFFNSTTNAIAGVGNGTAAVALRGLTTSGMMSVSSFAAGAKHWTDFQTTPGGGGWVIVDIDGALNNANASPGGGLPMLTSEYSTAISNVHQLQLMELDLDADYVLASNIDASPANAGLFMSAAGFVPIGGNDSGDFFGGTLDGRGHTISGLTINNPSVPDAGLFGVVSSDAFIQNVTLSHVVISQSLRFAGAVAGLNEGTISNVAVSGSMTGVLREAGGIAGETETGSVISGARSSISINVGLDANNPQMAGGLVGSNSGTISSSSASGSITGSYFAGGLVGVNEGTINTSHATGTVSNARQTGGGFVGENDGVIDQSYATGAVTDVGVRVSGAALGGFVGTDWGTITQSHATGDVSGSTNVSGGFYAGGFAGFVDGDGDIEQSYSNGSVFIGGKSARAGGFVGIVAGDAAIDTHTALIKNSYSTGAVSVGIGVTGVNGQAAGGFVGQNESTVEESYSTGAVLIGDNVLSGGFAAIDGGTVQNSYWDTNTSGLATSAGSATGLTTAQLQSSLPTGFDNTIWGTGAGAYPYLLWQFPSAPQIVSGYAYSDFDGSVLQGASVNFIANGVSLGSASTGANGYYYVTTSSGGSLNGADLFAYRTDGSAAALAKANVSGASDLILRNGYVSEQLDADDLDIYTNLASTVVNATNDSAAALSLIGNLGVAIGLQGGSLASYSLQGDANLGGHNLLIHDTDGSVHLTGTYTAGGLLLEGNSDFVLSMLGGGVSAIASDHVHSLSISADSINIGTVDGVRGITSASDVALTSSDGPIALNQQVKIGSGALSFNSQSDITENSAGRIIAASVTGVAAGSVSLNGANAVSQIDEFSALNNFSFTNSAALDVEGFSDAAGGAYALTTTGTGADITINGSISAATGMKLVSSGSILEGLNGQAGASVLSGSSVGETALTGTNTFNLGAFTSGGDMTLNSAGALDIVGSVNVGAHALVLNAGGGILEDGSAGMITAAALSGIANGAVTLSGANAIVGIKGFNTSGGDFSLTDAADLTVTDVISSGNGNLTLKTTGAGHDLILKNQVQSGGTVSLVSGGRISANANGIVSATILTGSSHGAVSLTAENIFARLGNFTTGGGALSITDSRFMSTAGKVDTDAGALTLKSETAARDLTIEGALYTSGTLSLISAGSITQSGAGLIHAGTLTGSANGTVTLANGKNLVANLRGFTTGLDGSLSLSDGQSLTVLGIVDAGAGNLTLTTIGVGSNIAIKNVLSANGAITLASAGKIAESGNGTIYAQSLTGSSVGGTTLGGQNFITTLSGFQNTGAGGFSITNGKALAVSGTLSAQASNAVVALTTTSGNLTLSGKVNSAVVTLVTAGEASQTAKSAIKAKTLNVTAKTGINLIGANHITAVGIRKTKSGPNVIKGIGS